MIRGDKFKGRKKEKTVPKEQIVRLELRLPKSKVDKLEEYRQKNNVGGNLQKAAELAMDREMSSFRLIDSDTDLINKVSFIKTIFKLSEFLYDIVMSEDKRFSSRNITAIVQTGRFLLDYNNKSRRLYDQFDFLPGGIAYYEENNVFT